MYHSYTIVGISFLLYTPRGILSSVLRQKKQSLRPTEETVFCPTRFFPPFHRQDPHKGGASQTDDVFIIPYSRRKIYTKIVVFCIFDPPILTDFQFFIPLFILPPHAFPDALPAKEERRRTGAPSRTPNGKSRKKRQTSDKRAGMAAKKSGSKPISVAANKAFYRLNAA